MCSRDVSAELGASTHKGLVLALLASRCNERVGVDELADAAWPAGPPRSYRKALQVIVVALRDLFEPERDSRELARSPLVRHDGAYELRLPAERIDAVRFEAGVRAGHRALVAGEPDRAAAAFTEALSIWGEPFAGVDNPYLEVHAERLRLSRRAARTGLIEADVQLGREDLSELERAVVEDPFDERRWGHLMIALFRRGRQADSLAAFRRARSVLVEELGVEPGQFLRKVERQVLLQDGELLAPVGSTASRPSPGAGDRRWPPVPGAAGPLLQRDDELRTLDTQLRTWRAVTIAGPPGVGKTTLAAAVARTRAAAETAWIPLGDVAAGPGALIGLAERLGVVSEQDADDAAFRRLIAERIGDRQVLLVLDNIEHLVEPIKAVVTELIRSCPNVVVLATSRRALGLTSERVYRLMPFGHVAGAAPGVEPSTGSTAGVAYLAARAGLDGIDGDGMGALQRICAHVGGLALGLEQAAARLQSVTPQELAERLELVDDRAAEGLDRAIAWSLDLLGVDAGELLRALAHLEGPWPLTRAEAIGAGLGFESGSVTGLVVQLLDSSLVLRTDTPDGTHSYRIIEPVRLHVRRSSPDGDTDRYAIACATSILTEVSAAARAIEGADQRGGLARLRDLMPDVRSTVIWASAGGHVQMAARVLAELRAWWSASGTYADGQSLYGLARPMIEQWSPGTPSEHGWRLRALSTGAATSPGFAAPAVRLPELERWLAEAEGAPTEPGVRSWLEQLLSSGLTFANRATRQS